MANDAAVYLHIDGFEGFDKSIDFDKKEIRKAMRSGGRLVERTARQLVARSESRPGEYPGRRTGKLQRAIKARVSRSGFMVKIAPRKVSGMRDYYPAFLYYGAKRKPGARRDGRSKGTASMRIEPRANYMVDAKNQRELELRAMLSATFGRALVIR